MQARLLPLLTLRKQVDELLELATLVPEDQASLLPEIAALTHAVDEALTPHNANMNAYDAYPALFTISAGVGGNEAGDFAKMLLRMYMRYFDKQALPYEVLEVTKMGEYGLKEVTLQFDFPHAYAFLAGEAGTHRLTRVSPYNAAGKRQTSFAAVEVMPLLGEVDAQFAEQDLDWDTYHSGGPGGQGVNTTDSAVRLTHKPSGLVVTIQGRSQYMNKRTARQVLASRLRELRLREQQSALQTARGERKGSWGTQVRTYNLAGGQYVKNNVTGYTRHDVTRVLDGDLTGFITPVVA